MVDFEKEGYVKEANLVDIREANRMGCSIMFPTLLFYAIPFGVIWHKRFSSDFFAEPLNLGINHFFFPLLLILAIVVGIVLHELIHGIFWAIFAKQGFRSIRFGIMKEHMTPYCHCTEPLKVKHYIIGALMPLLILGVVPGVISWFNGNWLWLVFGVFFTVSAIGDIMIVNLIRKLDKNIYVQDHPSEAGYYVFRKVQDHT